MTESPPPDADVLARIAAFYDSLPAEQPDRITRITISPSLRPWLRGLFPPTAESLLGLAGAATLGIPIVEDPQFLNGWLRIHRGEHTEDWFAVPPDKPERLVRFKEPVGFPFELSRT